MTELLVTRPEADAAETAARLSALGIEPVPCPLLTFNSLSASLPKPDGLSAIVLTSTNALKALEAQDKLAPYLHLPVFTVGDRTARAASAAGFSQVRSAGGTAEDLVGMLKTAQLNGPLFYPSGEHLSLDLARALAPAGLLVFTAPVYAMQAALGLPTGLVEDIEQEVIAGGLFYSRRTSEIFCAIAESALSPAAKRRFTAFCLSENVATPFVSAHFPRIALADHPSEDAMMAATLSFARDRKRS